MISRRRLLGAAAGATAAAAVGAETRGALAGPHRFRARVVTPEQISGRPTGTEVLFTAATVRREVALTFDDGPDPRWTLTVLALLARHGASATFFQVGARVKAHPGLTRAVHAAGHEVGNHTWEHRDVSTLSLDDVRQQLGRTDDELRAVTGGRPSLFRPPWGHVDGPGLLAATELGYRTILWSHRIRASDAAADASRDLANASPGMIVLCHDGGPTPDAGLYPEVERFVAAMTRDGYRFVTVSQLLAGRTATAR